ncbi:RNA methyltransferase [Planosporangium mesophilum]|uniref:rRNA methyltransferase n=1 Tax=Planosporangium mesophilum TaxID=689768 RepID=A0A8J3T8J6_9ACTN|nr:RNA methyltransferase [Planosporangium mesophilum]NJC81095.1 RNA methyltransferase [Planosporangium mesophilum]GII21257.1 rRNA methyltransferase [Planosporangium mesophilum]
MRITTRNARFQQWQSLLTNRAKRQRAGEFLVQGVRPINLAVEHGWPLHALLHRDTDDLSRWARDILDRVDAPRFAVAPDLLGELSDKDDADVELIAVAAIAPDDLSRIEVGPSFLGVVFDRPGSPGNIGTLLRSADAFGADGVIVTGHAADVYDPKTVRASTGSLFSVPAVRMPSHREVLDWADGRCAVVAADESAEVDVADHDLTRPTLLVIGNETVGLSAAWRSACDRMVRIPIGGSASSLNAATAASVLLYEAARQRTPPRTGPAPDTSGAW